MLVRGAGGDILEGMPPGQVKAARSMLQDLRVTIVTNAMVRRCTKLPHETARAPQLNLMQSQALNLSSIGSAKTTAMLPSAMLAEALTLFYL